MSALPLTAPADPDPVEWRLTATRDTWAFVVVIEKGAGFREAFFAASEEDAWGWAVEEILAGQPDVVRLTLEGGAALPYGWRRRPSTRRHGRRTQKP